jgi:hypothetical protein
MAVDASFVTLPTQLTTYVSNNADGSDASVFTSGSLNGYDSVEIAILLSGKISGVTSTTETLVHIYETGNGVPLEIISVIGNGTYSFPVPKHGHYTILAIANGYERQTAKITVSGNTTQNFAMVEKPKFTTQPVGGTVGYNERHIVNWATNFDPVKLELVRYSSAGNVVQIQELNAGAFQASLSYMTSGYYYRIRAYYDYSSDAYVESDKLYVTPDQYFTPNLQYGNTEGDIIDGITYVPNGDGTFNAHVHVDLNCVNGQMLQHEWYGTGYYWYDHNNKLTSGIGTTDTSELVFTLYNVGKNLVPGKAWKVKVYLADDPYADYEWRDIDFHYVTDTVPELKPEDAVTTSLTVNCIGDIDYTVSGNVVTVDHEVACKVGYLSGGSYVAITATANGDGTYSFTAPAGVTEVLLVVKGDANGDANVNIVDKMTVAKSLLLTTHPAYQALNSIQAFACNMDNVPAVNMVDKMTIAKSLLLPTHPAYQVIKW